MILKKVLLFILLIVLIGAAIALYLFNKGPVNVADEKGINITAAALYSAFSTDSAAALKKYAGKVTEVSGEVNSVSVNRQNKKIVMLRTGTENAFINCTMEDTTGLPGVHTQIMIKGICSGIGQGDEDLGIKGDVYLTRCVFEK